LPLHIGLTAMDMIERISRVLAARHYSPNAEGAAEFDEDATELVEKNWLDFEADAVAILKTMRGAPKGTGPAGEQIWEACIQRALGPYADH
jgi:hypothetical protein